MGRNTVGGKKGKSMANKSLHNNAPLRLSMDPLEKYACVIKMYGGGMCNVITEDGVSLMAHIRGNMRGCSKRNHFVTPFSIVLIALRPWESIPKNCDIIVLYSTQDVSSLALIPNIHILSILNIHNNRSISSNPSHNDDLLFSNTITTTNILDTNAFIDNNLHFDLSNI
jgi:translation initiation factor IF-1